MDARKCISYLTIEHRSEIDKSFKGLWDDWIYGCDICQEVCPWNRNPPGLSIDEFAPKKEITELSFSGISTMTEEQFDRVFHDTAVKRSGLSKLMRNMEFISKREPNGE